MSGSVLIDRNRSPEWAPFLSAAGLPATHWSDLGDPRAPDSTIMARALEHGSIVLTRDLDFGTALAPTRAAGPRVVQIRSRNILPEQVGTMVLAVLRRCEAELAAKLWLSLMR